MMSSRIELSSRRRTYVRLLGDVRHALNAALVEEAAQHGLTKAELARRIGRDKAFVTRKLDGRGNMTLETLADLAFALNRPVKVSLPARALEAGANGPEPSVHRLRAADIPSGLPWLSSPSVTTALPT